VGTQGIMAEITEKGNHSFTVLVESSKSKNYESENFLFKPTTTQIIANSASHLSLSILTGLYYGFSEVRITSLISSGRIL